MEKLSFGRELLIYGHIVTVKDYNLDFGYMTRRMIEYNGKLYNHFMVNGEIWKIMKIEKIKD
jgi:hypothetical protein